MAAKLRATTPPHSSAIDDERGRLGLELVEAVDDDAHRDGHGRQQQDRQEPRLRDRRQVGELLEAHDAEAGEHAAARTASTPAAG